MRYVSHTKARENIAACYDQVKKRKQRAASAGVLMYNSKDVEASRDSAR
jgi:hypothetical protein